MQWGCVQDNLQELLLPGFLAKIDSPKSVSKRRYETKRFHEDTSYLQIVLIYGIDGTAESQCHVVLQNLAKSD